MALVPIEENPPVLKTTVESRVSHQHPTQHKHYPINYDKLAELLQIEGLKGDTDDQSTPEAHAKFMKEYKNIFIRPSKTNKYTLGKALEDDDRQIGTIRSDKSTGPTAARSISNQAEVSETSLHSGEELSHNIKDYTSQIRPNRQEEKDLALKTDGVKILRKILRKLPFQRTAEDVSLMYKILKSFPKISSLVPKKLMKELCFVAQLDSWKEDDFVVFGSSGLHLILKGSVQPEFEPYVVDPNEPIIEFKRRLTQYKHDPYSMSTKAPTLGVGDCFGTLQLIDGQTMHKNMLLVRTSDANCEFLKITTSDYSRIIDQMNAKEQTKKLSLLKACEPFKMWTKQPQLKVADLIEWQSFAPNTVIVTEGYKAPFVGFVLKGQCHVLKQLDVLHTLPNGSKKPRTKQVVMGCLNQQESFAELSVLKEVPMNCSIITATDVILGVITPENLFALDAVTLELLLQSCKDTDVDLYTADRIQEEYMNQEQKREWNQYRHNAVIEAINAQGIRPGYGKWKKS